ncbi:MAG: cytochrome c [Verrucomicrobiales bacterium]|nr:cytochrome c [Verrucomicrobiales bacterium]
MKFSNLALALTVAVSFSASAFADEVSDAAAKGKAKFVLCGACHGLTGNGQPAPGMQMAASFLDSKILKMDAELSALVLFKGLRKENPAEYMGQIMMPLGATMPDEDVANIITYIRSEFGKVQELTTAEQVAAWRAKHTETPQPTRTELEKMGEKAE